MPFVQGIGKDNDDEEIVKVIISLAKSLGLQSVAEGVETREQVSFLHEHKCDVMQGYYFCRPMSAEVAAHVLEEILSEDKLEESQCSATN
jgi:EAL domain-containing protein (putative c-di-GMP-specific phosphodiesterase class I)